MILKEFNNESKIELAKLYAFASKPNYATISDYKSGYATKNLKLLPKNQLFKLKLNHLNNLSKQDKIYIIKYKNKIIATAFCKLNTDYITIDDFIVHDHYRYRNLGSLLLTNIKLIYPKIKLETNIKNKKAIKFFLKNGFKIYQKKEQTAFLRIIS